MAVLTEIDAINKMLRYVGELPLPSTTVIDSLPEGHEAIIARQVLNETNRELQEQGWWFNKENWVFVPDLDGYITMPNNVLSIKSQDKYLIKGGDLYSIADKTKIFADSIELSTVFEVPLSDLPASFSTYALYTASRQLHSYLNGDESTQKDLENNIQKAYLTVLREDMKYKDYNLITGARLLDRTTNPTALA